MLFITTIVFCAASLVFATNYDVNVGRTGLNFEPNILHNIEVGDIIDFHFYPANHSVAESTFDGPCRPKSGGVDAKSIFSGFVPTEDGVASTMWSMAVNTSDPIWLYCSQGSHQHCRAGQSMVINPLNDTDMTLDAYQEAALTANVSSPAEIFGGVLIEDDGGQPDQGSRASPTTSLSASLTASGTHTTTTGSGTAKPTTTSGVAPLIVNGLRQSGFWGLLVVVVSFAL